MHLTLACLKLFTVEPPVSDHPKCQVQVVAYGRWSFILEVSPRGVHIAGDFFVFGEALPVAPFLRHLLKQFSVFARDR